MAVAADFGNVAKLPDRGTYERPFDRRDAETLGIVLTEFGVELRYSTRDRRIELRESVFGLPTDAPWTPVNDRRMADIFDSIARQYWVKTKQEASPLVYGRTAREDAINALAYHREVDPFQEWLEALPQWDGNPRLEGLLVRNFGAPDDPLSHWAGRAPFIGAVQRAYEPGAKIDEVPVLIGKQGMGKSAYVQALLPTDAPEWHGDDIDLSAPGKEKAEALQGRVIVELSELSGLRRAEIEAVKSFVTRRDDGQHRSAYARNPEPALRRCVFIGTSNDHTPLPNDPSGNRRFVPVVLAHGCHIEVVADGNRVSWWAEALARHHDGEDGRLPRELHNVAARRAEEHRDRDEAIEDKIAAWGTDLCEPSTINEIAERLGFQGLPSRGDQMRIAAALRNCGWENRRDRLPNGQRPRRWWPPA